MQIHNKLKKHNNYVLSNGAEEKNTSRFTQLIFYLNWAINYYT